MKHHFSKGDLANAGLLLRLVRGNIDVERMDIIENLLEETDYYETTKPIAKDVRSKLWDICVATFDSLCRDIEFSLLHEAIVICQDFQDLAPNEKEMLNELRELCEKLETAEDDYSCLEWKLRFFTILNNRDKQIELLCNELKKTRVSKKRRVQLRIQLNTIYKSIRDTKSTVANLKELVTLSPHNLSTFGVILSSEFVNSEAYIGLISDYLQKNLLDFRYWTLFTLEFHDIESILQIYLNLGAPLFSHKEFYKEILFYGPIKQRIDILKKLQNSDLWDTEFKTILANLYLLSEDFDNATLLVDELIEEDSNYVRAILLKGSIYQKQKHYRNAIQQYRKAYEIDPQRGDILDRIFQCHACLGNNKSALRIFQEKYNHFLPKDRFRMIHSMLANEDFDSEFLCTCLNDLKVDENQPKAFWFDFDYTFEKIFKISENVASNGELRVGLLTLYKMISNLKRKLRLDITKNEATYHYSSLDSLLPLAKYKAEQSSRFRLSNVAYMNDPSEGEVFGKILGLFFRSEDVSDMLNSLYGSNHMVYRRTYLSSFSLRKDFLPMWVQYANKGNGCCYEIPTRLFGEYDRSIERQITQRSNKKNTDNRPVLYNVFYYDDQSKECINDDILQQCKVIGQTMLSLKKFCNNDDVVLMIAGMIDEIRYLFKSADYKTEEEVRVIDTDCDNSAKLTNQAKVGNQPPRLFLELSFEIKFAEIMLGPRTSDLKDWATYLLNCSNVGRVTKSKIQYQ